MKINKLRQKNIEELNNELSNLLLEQFNLRMQATNGHLQQNHLIKKVRRNIARVKTELSIKNGTCNDR